MDQPKLVTKFDHHPVGWRQNGQIELVYGSGFRHTVIDREAADNFSYILQGITMPDADHRRSKQS